MSSVGLRRLVSQQISVRELPTPAEVVAHLGAVQAQDYAGCKWAVGVRQAGETTDAAIEQALSEGTILRTHVLRGTWQLVTPADVRWMLGLVGPRVVASAAGRHRQLELDEPTFRRSETALVKALSDGRHRTRAELAEVLERAGVSTAAQRLSHLLQRAELDAVIVSGARRGKQTTHTLLDLRAPPRPFDRDEALSTLERRYFQSRGPATVQDFAWWSGLPVTAARQGLESIQRDLAHEVVDGRTYYFVDREVPAKGVFLLPPFDEFLIAYRDRDAVLDRQHVEQINAGGGLLDACIVVDGRVVGTWSRAGQVTVAPFEPTRRSFTSALERYRAFLA